MGKGKNRITNKLRTPYQGVLNIVRFNWHFYVLALFVVSVLCLGLYSFPVPVFLFWGILLVILGISTTTFISLLVSFYVYDASNFYVLKWIKSIPNLSFSTIATIHAGFDETSHLLQKNYPKATLHVFDFYNPEQHTEISIERARKVYPPYPDTSVIQTSSVPLATQEVDTIFVILAAHEIRNRTERILFFQELKRICKGKIIIVEHLRDIPNFLAYTIGFFHFLSLREWKITFEEAHLHLAQQFSYTPFLTVFVLTHDNSTT